MYKTEVIKPYLSLSHKIFLTLHPLLGFRSSVGLEQQPSKLWVLGSNPSGITKHKKRILFLVSSFCIIHFYTHIFGVSGFFRLVTPYVRNKVVPLPYGTDQATTCHSSILRKYGSICMGEKTRIILVALYCLYKKH